MATSHWYQELVSVHPALAEADRARVGAWRGAPVAPGEDPGDDVPPRTVRLGVLGTAFAGDSGEFTEGRISTLFRALEAAPDSPEDDEWNAVATGFLEALLNAWDRGYDLRAVWHRTGPRMRSYGLAGNEFGGIESPRWMRDD